MNRMFIFVTGHRLLILLALALLTLLAATGVSRLQVDTGVDSMVADSDPNRLIYESVTEEFGSDNQTLIFVRDTLLWSPAKLAALKAMHDRLAGLDIVQRVDDIFTLRSLRGEPGGISSKVFVEQPPDTQEAADRLKDDVLYNPLLKGNLVSPDGRDLALMVVLEPKAMETLGHAKVYAALQQAIEPAQGEFERIFQIGAPRIETELEDTLLSDMRTLAPVSALVLMFVILLFLRSIVAGLIPLATASLSLVWTMGMMGWAGIPVNILSAMLPTLIIVIGATEDTHLITTFLQTRHAYSDRDAEFCVRRMLRKMGTPLFLTVLTTVLGFASNIFSSIDLIRDFALASSFAMLANGIITILLVPIMLGALGKGKSGGGTDKWWLSELIVKFDSKSNRSMQRVVLFGTVMLCAFFLYEASKLYVTNDPMSYFKQDRELIRDAADVHEHLSGIKTFFITLQSNREQAFLHPANIRKLDQIESFISKQGVFDRSISLADYLKLLNREFHGGQKSWYQVPASKEMVSQYLLFMHRHDLSRYVSHDYKRGTIVVRHNISDSNVLNTNIAELRQVAKDIAGADMQVFVVGKNLMINEAAESLLWAQVKSLGILLLIIFLLMSVMFTSFKGGLIAMIPGVIPIILMFGVMGMLGIPLNPGTAMVAVIAIGIAIDSTIHMLSSFNKLSRSTGDAVLAAQLTVREEALPMIATSVALALGFGILLASDFAIIGQFGALSAATMLFALFANLIVTPLVMARVRLVGLYDIMALQMDKESLHDCRLFHDMSNYQIRKAMLISDMEEFSKGAKIIEQGSLERSMYLLIKGEVEVIYHGKDKDVTVTKMKPGDVFGEIAFVNEIRRTADVRAVSAVTVVKFDYERLKSDLRYFPGIVARLNFNISYILGERLAGTLKD